MEAEYTTQVLTIDLIQLLDKYLASMEFGEVIITRHQDKLNIDVKVRDRKNTVKLDIKK